MERLITAIGFGKKSIFRKNAVVESSITAIGFEKNLFSGKNVSRERSNKFQPTLAVAALSQ